MNKEDLHQDADVAVQDTKRITILITILTGADTEDGLEIQKDILKLHAGAGAQAGAAVLLTTTMTATEEAAAVAKEEAGTVMLKDIQRPLKEAGRTVAEDHAEVDMIATTIQTITHAVVARADGSEILKDMRKLLKEAGLMSVVARAAGTAIRKDIRKLLKEVGLTSVMVKAAGTAIRKDIRRLLKEAGSIAEAEQARAAEDMSMMAETVETHAADSLQWTAMR
jgi:methylmalonyl-CoA mutase cobalamin-binding subunit